MTIIQSGRTNGSGLPTAAARAPQHRADQRTTDGTSAARPGVDLQWPTRSSRSDAVLLVGQRAGLGWLQQPATDRHRGRIGLHRSPRRIRDGCGRRDATRSARGERTAVRARSPMQRARRLRRTRTRRRGSAAITAPSSISPTVRNRAGWLESRQPRHPPAAEPERPTTRATRAGPSSRRRRRGSRSRARRRQPTITATEKPTMKRASLRWPTRSASTLSRIAARSRIVSASSDSSSLVLDDRVIARSSTDAMRSPDGSSISSANCRIAFDGRCRESRVGRAATPLA